ncbi:MAG: SCO family protein [Lysobacterales bacterium]|nr:MAG: SCO family protein [Xanthomonadales bacterium]
MTDRHLEIPRRRLVIMALAIAVMGAVAGISLGLILPARQPAGMAALTLLPEPRVIAEFELLDHDGRPFTRQRLHGRWSLLFFGFTNCPDVCPSALYDLNRVSEQLPRPPGGAEPPHQVVFISVDPERDTPEVLARYVAHFNPEFTGVSGSHEQLAALSAQLGIGYQVEEHPPGAERYGVVHSSSVVLTDPAGHLRGAFTAPLDAAAMARDLATLIDQGE